MYAFIYFRIYWMTLSYPKRLINVHMYAFIYLYIYLYIWGHFYPETHIAFKVIYICIYLCIMSVRTGFIAYFIISNWSKTMCI